MKRRSTVIFLSVALGACACFLGAVLLAGGSYLVFMAPDRTADGSPSKMRFPLEAEEPASAGEEAVDQAEQALIDWMRNTNGAREQLGAQADELFRQVDEVRTASIQKMVRQNSPQARARPLTKPAQLLYPLPPSPWEPRHLARGESIGHILGYLATAPLIIPDMPRDEHGNGLFPPIESDDTPAENVHVHMNLQPKLVGSQLETEMEITIRAEKDGLVYEEKVGGSSRVDLCPNGQGEVHLELTLHGSIAAGEAGNQFQFKSQAVGHVDDEGNLTSYDIETQAETATQPGGAGSAKGQNNQFVEWNQRYSLRGLNGDDASVSGVEVNLTRWSSKVDQEFVDRSNSLISKLSSYGASFALKIAELKWKDGYCVEVLVPEMGSDSAKVVAASSETPFTAIVRHKFEGKELVVPVIANLMSGGVSVNPAGKKVPAPAAFRYRAPDKGGQTAKVELESRSRRGVGKTTLSFITSGYRVDQSIPYGTISGSICSLDKPFTLQLAIELEGASWEGAYSFTPSGEGSGTWSYAGKVRAAGMTGTNTGAGGYEIEGASESTPVIKMDAAYFTVSFPGIGGGSTPIQPLTLVLNPASDECQ